jgi:hypothetical protein
VSTVTGGVTRPGVTDRNVSLPAVFTAASSFLPVVLARRRPEMIVGLSPAGVVSLSATTSAVGVEALAGAGPVAVPLVGVSSPDESLDAPAESAAGVVSVCRMSLK